MKIKSILSFLLFTFFLSSCDYIHTKINNPELKDFPGWFWWFFQFFTPQELSHQEGIVFILLVFISISAIIALINSNRLFNFFNNPPFEEEILKFLLLRPLFLMFPLEKIKHPGWATGLWFFLRLNYLFLILLLLFALIFLIAAFLHVIIVIIIVIIIAIIIISAN